MKRLLHLFFAIIFLISTEQSDFTVVGLVTHDPLFRIIGGYRLQ